MNDESIFAAALGKARGSSGGEFLDGACGDDDDLRRRVERLIEADGQIGGVLKRGPDGRTDPPREGELPGERVGPYKLRQQLGEGGMGTTIGESVARNNEHQDATRFRQR